MSSRFKNKIVIDSILAAVSVLIIVIAWIVLGGKVSDLANRIFTSRAASLNANKEGILLAELKQESQSARAYQSLLNSKLVTKDNLLNFSNEVTLLGKEDNVNLGFQFGNEGQKNPQGLNSIGFVITATGDYNALVKFVADLEASPFYIALDSLNIVGQSGGQTGGMSATLGGTIYFYDNGK